MNLTPVGVWGLACVRLRRTVSACDRAAPWRRAMARSQQIPCAAAGLRSSRQCSRAIVPDGAAGAAGVRDLGQTRTPSTPLRASRHLSYAGLRELPIAGFAQKKKMREVAAFPTSLTWLRELTLKPCIARHLSFGGESGGGKQMQPWRTIGGASSRLLGIRLSCPELCRLN